MTLSTAPRLTTPAAATTLGLWCHAWQAGASADAVLDVLAEIGMRAGVRADSTKAAVRSGLPGPGEPSGALSDLLPVLRRGGAAQLLTPVAGDVRGLPPGGDILGPALDSGAVVVLPDVGIGLVPVDGLWRAYECAHPHPALDMGEATRLVDAAVADATRLLARAEVASDRGNPREAMRRATAAHAVAAPPGLGSAATALLDRATTLAALLDVAAGHDTAAVTGRQTELVNRALAPLHTAVRDARRTVVATAADAAL